MDIVVTKRLVLRNPIAGDLQLLHDRILSNPEVMRLTFSGSALTLEQSEAFFDANFDHDQTGKGLNVLVERATGEAVGFAGLLPCTVLDRADYELGFVLCQAAWGKGFATEIGLGQIEYGLSQLGLDRLLAQASPRNSPSIKTLQKIGMSFHSAIRSNERGERHVFAVNRQ
jgi:[ribosomal protein S5]-alanine N-acetyltransferase